jgi:uncharacterized membrane protein (UPF0127 family)
MQIMKMKKPIAECFNFEDVVGRSDAVYKGTRGATTNQKLKRKVFCSGFIRSIFLSCIISIIFSACQENPPRTPLLHTITINRIALQVEIARTPHQLQTGLMYRQTLPIGTGMLFIHPIPNQLSYWMKNTSIPLDIGFFDEFGVLMEIYPLYPYNLNAVSSKNKQLKYALEVPQGWFKAVGLSPGAQLDLSSFTQ